jgi:hypothetical protein
VSVVCQRFVSAIARRPSIAVRRRPRVFRA